MRSIKFRSKRIDNGEWVYGWLYSFIPYGDYHERGYMIKVDGGDDYEVRPETIGEYTGLHDKNGKEIYEGDVLKTDLSRPYLVVVFRNGAFMYECHDSGKDYYDFMAPSEKEIESDAYLEVIGNIHENPEFLEVSQ